MYRILYKYIFISLEYKSRGEIAGSDGSCMFSLLEAATLFSRVAVPFYIPISSMWVIQFVLLLIFIIPDFHFDWLIYVIRRHLQTTLNILNTCLSS